MKLPKERFVGDVAAVEKAAAMVRRGHSDAFISDYLGMVQRQVRAIRRETGTGTGSGRRPSRNDPGPDAGNGAGQDRDFRRDAMAGSAKLRDAILAYYARHHDGASGRRAAA